MTEENCYKGSVSDIAVSLSGGGVRAVGYHLGTLSMLDRLDMLKNVKILSSVSGGSLPGLGYSISQRVGRSFQDFFDDFYVFLPQMNTVEELLERLTGDKSPSPSGRRDLITSMANLYNDLYFEKFFAQYSNRDDGKLTFDILMSHPRDGHLTEMIFNATEFKSGAAFRFQVSEYRCLIGNADVAICPTHARQIRIADVQAASSCIPGGMEPLFFPDDFHWPDDETWSDQHVNPKRETCNDIKRSLQNHLDTRESSVALMDGGVYDNQGMISTILAINRRKEMVKVPGDPMNCGFSLNSIDEPSGPEDWAKWMAGRGVDSIHRHDLDLLIISDTPVRRASFYPRINLADVQSSKAGKAAKTGKKRLSWLQKFNIDRLDKLLWAIAALLVTSAVMTIWDVFFANDFVLAPHGLSLMGEISYLFLDLVVPLSLVILFAVLLIVYSIKRDALIDNLENVVPNWRRKPREYIKKIRLSDLFKMGELRAGSVGALTSSIFMNRIRGLSYSTVYGRDDLHDRIIANEIFALQGITDTRTPLEKHLAEVGHWPPPLEMLSIVDKAATMNTKLWIDHDEGDPLSDLDYLVICGQVTTCYKLMTFMWDNCRADDGTWLDEETRVFFERAVRVWASLYNDPKVLLMDRKRNSRLEELNQQAADLAAQQAA